MRFPRFIGVSLLSLVAWTGCQFISGVTNLKVEGGGGSGLGGGAPGICGANASCSEYCAGMWDCKAPNQQYETDEQCCAVCGAWPTSLLIQCRLNILASVGDAPTEQQCATAGPTGTAAGGTGGCGKDCDNFCALGKAACPSVYGDEGACHVNCQSWILDAAYDVESAPTQQGGYLACPMFYLVRAAAGDPEGCALATPGSDACKAQ